MNAPQDPARALYEAEVKRHVLALREALVRHDENLAANALLQEAVPYFLKDDPEISQARADQYAMVRHIFEPDAYGDYYANNPHERAFELQYGIEPDVAHDYLYRVQFLRDELERLCKARECEPQDLRIIDLSANDGWMAVNLGALGFTVDCVDLHPGNCDLARKRKADGAAGIGQVACTDLHALYPVTTEALHEAFPAGSYDAVVCFETLEHVRAPIQTLQVMKALAKPDGRLFVSTPHEAIERGNVPNWAQVESKGHVRAVRPKDLHEWLAAVGSVERFELGPDRVMVAAVR